MEFAAFTVSRLLWVWATRVQEHSERCSESHSWHRCIDMAEKEYLKSISVSVFKKKNLFCMLSFLCRLLITKLLSLFNKDDWKSSCTWITSTLYLFSYGWLSSYNWCRVWHTDNRGERAEGEASDLGHGRAGEIPCGHTQLLQRSRRGPHGVWHHQVHRYVALMTLRLHVQCCFFQFHLSFISHKEHMWFLFFAGEAHTTTSAAGWLMPGISPTPIL